MKKLCHSNAKREGKETAGEMLDNFSKRNLCHAIFECATRTMNEGQSWLRSSKNSWEIARKERKFISSCISTYIYWKYYLYVYACWRQCFHPVSAVSRLSKRSAREKERELTPGKLTTANALKSQIKVKSGVHKSKIKDEIKVREDKPSLVNQRCVVYHFKCWLYVPKPTITNWGTQRIDSCKPSQRTTWFGTRRHRAKF